MRDEPRAVRAPTEDAEETPGRLTTASVTMLGCPACPIAAMPESGTKRPVRTDREPIADADPTLGRMASESAEIETDPTEAGDCTPVMGTAVDSTRLAVPAAPVD